MRKVIKTDSKMGNSRFGEVLTAVLFENRIKDADLFAECSMNRTYFYNIKKIVAITD